MSDHREEKFEPRIVVFCCTWCTNGTADLAGDSHPTYPPNIRIVRVMCSGEVEPQFILSAFREGADGVLIGGCRLGDCHHEEGNFTALRRHTLMKVMLSQLGIESERIRQEWISVSEGDRVRSILSDMTERIRRLGPMSFEPITAI